MRRRRQYLVGHVSLAEDPPEVRRRTGLNSTGMNTDQKVLTSPVPDAIRYSGSASTVCGTIHGGKDQTEELFPVPELVFVEGVAAGDAHQGADRGASTAYSRLLAYQRPYSPPSIRNRSPRFWKKE